MAESDLIKAAATRLFKNVVVEPETGCHFSPTMKNRNTYRRVTVGGRHDQGSRVAWASVHGPIPAGMMICHRCDTPACFNVDHLFIGTAADNHGDRNRKGRQARGKTHGDIVSVTTRRKIPANKIPEIIASGLSNKALAALHGVTREHINRIRKGLKCSRWASPV